MHKRKRASPIRSIYSEEDFAFKHDEDAVCEKVDFVLFETFKKNDNQSKPGLIQNAFSQAFG